VGSSTPHPPCGYQTNNQLTDPPLLPSPPPPDRYDSGPDMTSGVLVSHSDMDFQVDVDPATGEEMVIVQENVQARHHAEFLARHISRFEEIVRDLEAPPAALKAAA
jgi:translation initiation factor 3 subunit L